MPLFQSCKPNYTMSKFLYLKCIILFSVCLFSVASVDGQTKAKFKGQLLFNNKPVMGVVVTTYQGKKFISQTGTNSFGKFWLNLEVNQKYVIQFKSGNIPVLKAVINTKSSSGKFSPKGVLIFRFSSKDAAKEGPSADDAAYSFSIDDKGGIAKDVEDEQVESSVVESKKAVKIEKQIEQLEDTVKKTIAELPKEEKNKQEIDYNHLNKKKDSILYLAEQKAALLVANAQQQTEKIIRKNKQLEKKYKKPIINTNSTIQSKISKDLKRFALKESKFLENERVKGYHSVIEKYSKKKKLSTKDSLEYINNVLLFNEEMIKSAWLQLEVDKLNARTKEDSLALEQREQEIMEAEAEIANAKDKIELQKAEIDYKNTILILVVLALIILVVFLFMLYKNFKDKKKSNTMLAKKNSEIAKKNKKIMDSIRYAQTIQQAILPIHSVVDKYFNWFVVFKPKDIVSGDFYWFNHFEESKKSVFAVVDCTGHGVPGAFMSLIGNRLLVEAVKEKGITNPVEILEKIDSGIRIALMQDETENNDGMDICVCSIEKLNDNEFEICFAGAKRPLFYTDKNTGEIQHIKGTVRGIGGKKRLRERAKKPFVEHKLILNKGEKIYLTTDGLFDLQSPTRKKYGRLNFMDLLKRNQDKPLSEQYDAIIETLEEHKKSEAQIDDITVLGIEL